MYVDSDPHSLPVQRDRRGGGGDVALSEPANRPVFPPLHPSIHGEAGKKEKRKRPLSLSITAVVIGSTVLESETSNHAPSAPRPGPGSQPGLWRVGIDGLKYPSIQPS